MLVVHPHFHRRRTGITRHVESVLPSFPEGLEARALGAALAPAVPRIGWGELLFRLRKEPVLWHAHRNNELLVGLLLSLLGRRVRLVYTRHAVGRPSLVTRWLARLAHLRVALTRQVAERLELPSTVVAHGVELWRYSPPADREEAWRRLGLGGAHGIGVIGRIRPAKGQGDFVRAVSPLLARHPQWRAVLVGLAKPPERRWLAEVLAAERASIDVIEEQPDVLPFYRGLTVLVQPSHEESFSLVLLEGLAAGCCVVAARLPHFPELIEHGRTGFLYPPGDAPALRELLEELMREPKRAEQVGRHAAEEARARFGVEREARDLAELYRAAMGEGG